ncbi:hypothetical protein DLJ96_00450 [Actinotalea fermentans ATCC 43279 = JCM 9966 = DSM 3133]|nr:hypothetical protein DLJ96_00450 [Actinotalea fermentans ATCC 43279 = JCM 9966 = DSM 3133]
MPDPDRAENPVLGHLRTTASHTIGIPHLTELLRAVPAEDSFERYRSAVVEENALGRPTHAGRLRTFRHLRELYLLDVTDPRFAALRRLWDLDADAQPLLAGLLAFTRDELLRASWPAVARVVPGGRVMSDDLSNVVAERYAGALSSATLGKIGRNTGACWTQTGHLEGHARKVRATVEARPAAVALAAYLGYLDGGRALHVLDNPWSALLGVDAGDRLDALRRAHDAGLLDLQVAGQVVEVGFSLLERGPR